MRQPGGAEHKPQAQRQRGQWVGQQTAGRQQALAQGMGAHGLGDQRVIAEVELAQRQEQHQRTAYQ